MPDKLQELTEKIYAEGVQKAKEEARRIIESANQQASTIVASAQKQADAIVQNANLTADNTRQQLKSELKLAADQAIMALQQQLTDAISLEVVKPPIDALFNDKPFIQNLILKMVETWSQTGHNDIELLLPESEQQHIDTAFQNSLIQRLNNGIDIRFSKNINAGFRISPKGENYKLSFTSDDFIQFFKTHLRPKTKAILFDH